MTRCARCTRDSLRKVEEANQRLRRDTSSQQVGCRRLKRREPAQRRQLSGPTALGQSVSRHPTNLAKRSQKAQRSVFVLLTASIQQYRKSWPAGAASHQDRNQARSNSRRTRQPRRNLRFGPREPTEDVDRLKISPAQEQEHERTLVDVLLELAHVGEVVHAAKAASTRRRATRVSGAAAHAA